MLQEELRFPPSARALRRGEKEIETHTVGWIRPSERDALRDFAGVTGGK